MKGIQVTQFGGPEVLKLADTPSPKAGPGQIVVQIKAAGVNPVDTYIRTGTYPIKPSLPFTPGFDGAGTVKETGSGTARFKKGDRVYISGSLTGSYAEEALCEESAVHPLPEKISFSQGAALNVPYATAIRALYWRAHGGAGQTVLIHGASGGVGIAAVQLARASGLKVIGTAGSQKGIELVKKEGAHHVLDHTKTGYLDEINRLTDGKGVDVILEMLANVNLAKDLAVLAKRGKIVVIGCRGPVEIEPRLLMAKEASIHGMVLFNLTPEEKISIHGVLYAGLENGTLRPVIGKELKLEEASRAHEDVMKPGAYGKIVLIP